MEVFSDMNLEQQTDREEPAVDAAGAVPEKATAAASVVQKAAEPSDAEKRRAHEESEARRKAEWEAQKKARAEAEQTEWEKAVAVDDETLIANSVKRLGDATERLTRRNMKLCVTEYVQTMCYEDLNFARLVMHPRKNMVNCFHFINRKAREYLEQEMKGNDEKPQGNGFGGDVPDEMCYQWAVEYFRARNAKEDKTDADKEFIPKPYRESPSSKPKKKPRPEKAEAPKKPEMPKQEETQISLFSAEKPAEKTKEEPAV